MGSHFYDRDGSPRYTVRGANGMERDSTLADARKHSWCPSVTTVLDVLAKPGLVRWQIDQAILATLTLPKAPHWPEDEYLRRIRSDAGKQARDAAQEGTRIHDAIEKHYKGERYDDRYHAHVCGAVAEITRSFPQVHDWVAEESFAHPSGYGGRVDLHSRAFRIVLDSKSKDLAPDDNDRLAFDQYIQCAACAEGLGIAGTCGTVTPAIANLFVSRTHPGIAKIHVWDAGFLERGICIFRAALAIYKAQRGYESGWQP